MRLSAAAASAANLASTMWTVRILCVTSISYAGNGFFLGGAADGMNNNQAQDRNWLDQLEVNRQRQLNEQNNRILQEQQDRQRQLDNQRLFGIHRNY